MKPTTTTEPKTKRAASLFGSKFADNPLAQEIISNVATWPKSKSQLTDRLGNLAQVMKWKARRGKKQKQIVEARNHPAVEWLLDIIIPALCDSDPKPFQWFADAIQARNANAFPDKLLPFITWQSACELSGATMPFMATGEPADVMPGMAVEQPAIICVPVTESELRKEVEKRLGWQEGDLNSGQFTRLIHRLEITCHKKHNSGGRGRKVLPKHSSKQKPKR